MKILGLRMLGFFFFFFFFLFWDVCSRIVGDPDVTVQGRAMGRCRQSLAALSERQQGQTAKSWALKVRQSHLAGDSSQHSLSNSPGDDAYHSLRMNYG